MFYTSHFFLPFSSWRFGWPATCMQVQLKQLKFSKQLSFSFFSFLHVFSLVSTFLSCIWFQNLPHSRSQTFDCFLHSFLAFFRIYQTQDNKRLGTRPCCVTLFLGGSTLCSLQRAEEATVLKTQVLIQYVTTLIQVYFGCIQFSAYSKTDVSVRRESWYWSGALIGG